jgi:anti-sigma regulatory factor (Ser/Thr protein kinase)
VSGADDERLTEAVHGAADVDSVARAALAHLATLPGVSRAGLALTEGAGRRLRFVASDELDVDELEWCHIDAYDDVPLTSVVRTGRPVVGSLDELEHRYAGVVAHQRTAGTCALAAVVLPGRGAPVGGLVLFYDEDQKFDRDQRLALEAAAQVLADAVHRVTGTTGPAAAAAQAPAAGERSARLLLDRDARVAGDARRFLRDRLELWGIDQVTSDTAQLCLSELVNNVIMHARSSSELTITLEDGVLRVVLRDHGGSRPGQPAAAPVPDDDPLRVFGRGLTLVDAFADTWGTDRDEVGTTAWFTLTPGA